MEIMDYYVKVLKNYVTFTGRARRKEYWYFALANIGITMAWMILAGILYAVTGAQAVLYGMIGILYLYVFATLLPSLAVVVRRLHDTGKSGWFYFVAFIPLVGGIWLLVLMCTEGDHGDNEYGADPKQFVEVGHNG